MSLTNSIALRNVDGLSFEAAQEADLAEFALESASIESKIARINRIYDALDSAQALTRRMFQTGKPITEHQAHLYQLSVESIFKAAGEELDSGLVFVSFESATDYSVEAEKKAWGAYNTIISWLASLINALGSSIKSMAKYVSTATNRRHEALVGRRNKIKAKMEATASAKAFTTVSTDSGTKVVPKDVPKTVRVAKGGLLGKGTLAGVTHLVDTAKANQRKASTEVTQMVNQLVGVIKQLDVLHSSGTGMDVYLKHLFSIVGAKPEGKEFVRRFEILPGYGVMLKFTPPGKLNMAWRGTSETYRPAEAVVELPTLSLDECLKLADVLIEKTSKDDDIKKVMDAAGHAVTELSTEINALKTKAGHVSMGVKGNDIHHAAADRADGWRLLYSNIQSVLVGVSHVPAAVTWAMFEVGNAADRYGTASYTAH